MVEKDFIKDLFADKLANAQAPVNPELWSAISSKIGASTAVSTGLSTTAKWLIGLGTAASVTVATVFLTNNDNTPTKVETPKTQLVSNELVSDKDSVQNESTRNNMDSIDDFKKGTYSFVCGSMDYHLVGSWHCQCGEWPSCAHQDVASNAVDSNNVKNLFPTVSNLEQYPIKQVVSSENPSSTASNNATNEGLNTTATSSFELKQLPNVFTLNNDGKNDQFFIEMKGIEDFVLTVLNSKNEVVYSTVDADFKWDGRDKQGNLVDSGAYIYFFTGKDLQGNPISKHSSLRVIVK